MASAVVLPAASRQSQAVPSHNRCESGSLPLAAARLPAPGKADEFDADRAVSQWIAAFNSALSASDYGSLLRLFLPESYYRDQLCLSWDFHTFKGATALVSFLESHPQGCRLRTLALDGSSALTRPAAQPLGADGSVIVIGSFLTVETDVGRGRGHVRLCKDASDGKYKAFTLFTGMFELKGFEEPVGARRPHGVQHGFQPGKKNWRERRAEEQDFATADPSVLIVGAGQGGLTLAARLRHLGVSTLIVDRNARIGDNWRNRYHHLVLHDPVSYDHMPYVSFPPGFPKFIPKDKLGDWFESYAGILELNAWMSTELLRADYSDSEKRWEVDLVRRVQGSEERRTLHPRFIVQATGLSGEINFPDHIKGISEFKGDLLCHSSKFPGAKANSSGRRAIVVGCCNSALDIAQDYCENGYDVTVVQRSSVYVMSSEEGLDVMLGSLYAEGGPPIDDADLLFNSIPNPLLKRLHMDSRRELEKRDASLLQGLRRAGFKLDAGPDDSGLVIKYYQRGGGYYIDVGAAQLIADGKIKVKQGQEIAAVNEHSVTFEDGTELPADEVIFATGYQNMRTTCRKIFGDAVADKTKHVWGFDEEGELRTVWRRSGHEGFWFMGGNLALCRYFSRMLALQLKALDEGIMKHDDL